MATAYDVSPTHCRAKGAGFVVDVLAHDPSGKPCGRVAVSPDELLNWVQLAVEYDPRFRAALELRLTSIRSVTKG